MQEILSHHPIYIFGDAGGKPSGDGIGKGWLDEAGPRKCNMNMMTAQTQMKEYGNNKFRTLAKLD